MKKMAIIPIYGTSPLNSFSQEQEGRWPWDLVYSTWNVGHTVFKYVDIELLYGEVKYIS